MKSFFLFKTIHIHLSRHEADHLIGQSVWPWQTHKLIPVPRDDLSDVEASQKCDGYDAGKSGTFERDLSRSFEILYYLVFV